MIENPIRYIERFYKLGAKIITIHPEADRHAARTLSAIAELGAQPGIALNPGTSLESVLELFPLCEHVLAMTVNPGYAGQAFLDFTVSKIRRLGVYAREYDFTLCVDGGVTAEKIKLLRPLGVDSFVVGQFLFQQDDYARVVRELQN
jgi:ribulose-phosphate 3-epimerase